MRSSSVLQKTSSRQIRHCALLIGLGALLSGADAPEPSADALMRSLQAHYESVQDIHAEFTQTSFAPALDSETTSQGKVVVQRPGRMRWEYSDGRVILLLEDTLKAYSPEDRQLQIARVANAGVSPTALSFLLGTGRLDESFTGKRVRDPSRPELGLELIPRGDASFESLILWLTPEDHRLRESQVTDLFGNRTTLRLASTVENAGVRPEELALEVPDGTEVIDLR